MRVNGMSRKTCLLLLLALAAVRAESAVDASADAAPAADDAVNEKPAAPAKAWEATKLQFPEGTYIEQFASNSPAMFRSKWVPSQSMKEDIPHHVTGEGEDAKDAAKLAKQDKEHFRYKGQWSIEEPRKDALSGAARGDLGLVLKSAAAHHAISSVLPKPVVFEGNKMVVVQYEVKLQNGLECGGAYMKLLSAAEKPEDLAPQKYSDKTPYTIMFGPDKCGTTNKVHFIFRFLNPTTGVINEHHLTNGPTLPSTYSKETHLYTLKIFPEDNTYEVLIDNESKKKGSLYDDFEPPVVPPEQIEDPNDHKPSDWVDIAQIPDPKASKPDSWDEDQPMEIVDKFAKKPEDWLEDEPEFIPDPEAQKPEDWDEDEDGEWIAPQIPNPKCANVSGCGPWTQPMRSNPLYVGKWTPPLIANPEYKGPWSPRLIPNPEYFEDKHVGYLNPIGAIGFELWTMQNDILFDNIVLSNSITDKLLSDFTKETWGAKHAVETALIKAETAKANLDKNKGLHGMAKKTLPLNEQLTLTSIKRFANEITADPIGTAKEMPVVTALFAIIMSGPIVWYIFSWLFGTSSTAAAAKTDQKKDEDAAEDTDAATATTTASNKNDTSALMQRAAAASSGDADDE
ncbi:hypothetical protein RI367_008373 [Sorochytrium milnesiophthora]